MIAEGEDGGYVQSTHQDREAESDFLGDDGALHAACANEHRETRAASDTGGEGNLVGDADDAVECGLGC